jgi:hypothetical protein
MANTICILLNFITIFLRKKNQLKGRENFFPLSFWEDYNQKLESKRTIYDSPPNPD